MKVTGGCFCGLITFEAEADLEKAVVCHCTDCQILTGGALRANVVSKPDTFRLLSGELKTFVKTAESGRKRLHGFCPECGTPISSSTMGDGPSYHTIRAGILKERDQVRPALQIWARSKAAWVGELASVPAKPTGPES